MPRIKRKGLLYFPLDAGFCDSRPVRRLCKNAGDASVSVLIRLMGSIYSGEGYYVLADDEYFEDLLDSCYDFPMDFLKRVVDEAVRQKIFDAGLYAQYRILTSADIQQQYLLCMKQKDQHLLDERYNLIAHLAETHETETATDEEPQKQTISTGKNRLKAENKSENVTETGINNSFHGINTENPSQSTQTKEKQKKEKQTKGNPLLNGSPQSGRTREACTRPAEEADRFESGGLGLQPVPATTRFITMDDVKRLQPPADGLNRNLKGLLLNMGLYNLPPDEQYAIVLTSNYGQIGHPVWRAFEALRVNRRQIREPGRFLLSYCEKREKTGLNAMCSPAL